MRDYIEAVLLVRDKGLISDNEARGLIKEKFKLPATELGKNSKDK